jgi:hypothetical protein
MHSLSEIQRTCGAQLAKYVKNKSTGGESGQKGTRYEDRLAIFIIAEASIRAFENRTGDFENKWNATVYSQVPCFIDDLIVRQSARKYVAYYQAKNRMSSSWGSGRRSLRSDFRNQLKLCKALKVQCRLVLAVSNRGNSETLSNSIPSEVRRNTSVFYFPGDNKITRLLRTCPPFRDALQDLTPFVSASDDILVSAATVLAGIWSDSGNRISTKSVIARMMAYGAPLVRPLKAAKRLPPSLRAVLDGIAGFNYSLQKGYMHWTYGTADRGCYRYHCGSRKFKKFAKLLVVRRPRPVTFDEIEGML